MKLINENELVLQLEVASQKDKYDFSPTNPYSFVGETENGGDLEISNKEFLNVSVKHALFCRIRFNNCQFKNCSFEIVEFNGIEFNDCIFLNCHFEQVTFMDMTIKNVRFNKLTANTTYFGMLGLENVEFNDSEFQFITFSDCHIQNVTFCKTCLTVAKFESGDFFYAYKSTMLFDQCTLQSVIFIDLDLSISQFLHSELGRCSFNNSVLSVATIAPPTEKYYQISNIDFLTIRQSEHFSKKHWKMFLASIILL